MNTKPPLPELQGSPDEISAATDLRSKTLEAADLAAVVDPGFFDPVVKKLRMVTCASAWIEHAQTPFLAVINADKMASAGMP